jgi:RimJ/RimL family protein N-acetyltransferase
MPFLLSTARQILRHLEPGDAEMMFALNGDPEVMRYLPDAGYASVEAAREFLVQYQDVYKTDGFARWAAVEKASGECVGWCGLRKIEGGEIDLGYRYLRSAWGRGLATEAAEACVAYGFETLGLERIVARAELGNVGSNRVLEKVGLRFQRNETAWGREVALWTLTRDEWAGRN